MKVKYDKESDVLCLLFSGDLVAESSEDKDGVIYRLLCTGEYRWH
ncbi:MAG: DUF2283 domain-containing protein [Prevotellaceae bacterium]|nr:DUF2283 domain-containing protein [Prevotellaceae bacterium]